MKSRFQIPGLPPELQRNVGRLSLTAATLPYSPDSSVDAKVSRARAQHGRGRIKFNPKNQPRDRSGKFRDILARLKQNLGDESLQEVVEKIKKAEALDDVGDYSKSTKAGQDVIKLIDAIDDETLDKGVVANLRDGAAELGRVLAHLPLPQGDPNAKVRFSDLPPSTGRLIKALIERVKKEMKKPKEAAKMVKVLESFISGVRSMTSDELSAEMNKLLRVLT